MFSLVEIVQQNRNTFYDYSTNKQRSLILPNIIKISIAAILAILFGNFSKDFFDATITIYSILIGFSLNILFYLLSAQRERADAENLSIERKIAINKTNKITNELFYNVSYFNVISICVVLVALIFFLFECRLPKFGTEFSNLEMFKIFSIEIDNIYKYTKLAVLFLYHLIVYALLIESMYTLIRTIGRVSYFFSQKMALQDEDE